MKKSYLIAVAITLLIAAWVFSGHIWPSASRASQSDGTAAPARGEEKTTVRGRVFRSRDHVADVVLRGRTGALRSVRIKAQTDGRVVALPVEKGARVKAGQLICRLAVDDREARLAQARALVGQRQLEFDAAAQLAAKGYRAETQVAGAKAQLDAAKAQVAQREVELTYTRIVAPFDGVIDDRPAEIGDYLQKGQECAIIVDEDPYLVVGEVSERNVAAISVGDRGKVRLLDGAEIEGKVRFIARIANPATRTFRIELEVANPGRRLRDGLTAEIRVAVRSATAHEISPALLVLDELGRVGVRIVDGDETVRFAPVEIVGDTPDGMWVTGLPDEVTIITVGQEFVKAGEKIALSLENAGAAS